MTRGIVQSQGSKSESGFTIVELIITIVILGILATSIIMRSIDLSHTAQAAACRSNQLTLESAQMFYFTRSTLSSNGVYATSLDELAPYLINNEVPHCPGNGTYRLLSAGRVECTDPQHHRD